MLTIKQKEKLLDEYIKEKHNLDECYGFSEALDRVISLFEKQTSIYVIMENFRDQDGYLQNRVRRHYLDKELALQYIQEYQTQVIGFGFNVDKYYIKEEDLYS